jgi:hypothetical protein
MAYKKMTNTENTVKEDIEQAEEAKVEVEETKVEKMPVKEYAPEDTIKVMSVTPGELFFTGKKSGINYSWSGYGDTALVEYQDLLSELYAKGHFLYHPYFIIDDVTVLNGTKWNDIKKLYDSMYKAEDITEILKLSLNDFTSTLESSPTGLKEAIKTAVADGVANGTFDSLQKIKAVDRICGTEIAKLMLE